MRKSTIFKASAAWKWLKQNHKGILLFFATLLMGAGIAPTVQHGKGFVAAIRFEKMAEVSPAYAVMREIEPQVRFYVLSVELPESVAMLWVLPSGNFIAMDDELDPELYVMFVSLAKNYPDMAYYVIAVAGATTAPAATGPASAFTGVGYFTMSAVGVEQLIAAGIENAYISLKALFDIGDFDAQSLEGERLYMTNLLPRAPGQAFPWEEE